MSKTYKLKGPLFLFCAAFCWGSAFIAQKICSPYPFATNTLRFLLGALFMVPVLIVFNKQKLKKGYDKDKFNSERKKGMKGGIICGINLAFASTLQQLGMTFGTTAGKSGFLTSLYMVIIPVLGLFFHKKVNLDVWISVVIAFCGAFLLSFSGSSPFCTGDILTLICAIGFSFNTICIGKFLDGADAVTMSVFQLLSAGLVCCVPLIAVNIIGYEVLTLSVLKAIILPVLYIAVFSCCIAYTCQVLGQRYTPPAHAAIIMSLESVFSVIFGIIILHESLTLLSSIGIVLIFIAIIITQTNPLLKIKNNRLKKLSDTSRKNNSDPE